jgi:hypothetical protein
MKKKRYVQGITFFTTEKMHEELVALAEDLEMSVSEILRRAVKNYLRKMVETKALDQSDIIINS